MTTAVAELHGRSLASEVAARIREGLARYVSYRQTVSELQGLSNRMLADLGIERGSLREIARREIYGL